MVKRIKILTSVLILTGIGAMIGIGVWSDGAPFRGESFDQGRWADFENCYGIVSDACTEEQQFCPRGAMLQDLQHRYLHEGQSTRVELHALLGQPDDLSAIGSRRCESYLLGVCSDQSLFEGDSLYLCFDENDILDDAGRIVR